MTQKYTVKSDRVVGCEAGDTVTADDLPGVNVAALVAAGHLKKAATPKASEKETK